MADDKPTTLADDEIPYQQRPYLVQLRNELANALAYGQDDRVRSVRKQLAELRASEEPTAAKAAETRKAAATEPSARSEPPAERATPRDRQSTTTAAKPTGRA
jgi:hypothetical protein